MPEFANQVLGPGQAWRYVQAPASGIPMQIENEKNALLHADDEARIRYYRALVESYATCLGSRRTGKTHPQLPSAAETAEGHHDQ